MFNVAKHHDFPIQANLGGRFFALAGHCEYIEVFGRSASLE